MANSGEAYWFKITTPANASNVLTAFVQSSNLSELSPRVQIYNSALQGLSQTSAAPSTYGATISTNITNATPNTVYYFKVLGSNSAATGTGAYDLTIDVGNTPIGLGAPPNTTVAAQADQGGGYEFETTGGLGGWLKAFALNGTIPDLAWLKGLDNPPLEASITSLIKQVTSSRAALEAIEARFIGYLQAAPDQTIKSIVNALGSDDPSSVTRADLGAIFSGFFAGLDVKLFGPIPSGH